jgi:hypothetical protein
MAAYLIVVKYTRRLRQNKAKTVKVVEADFFSVGMEVRHEMPTIFPNVLGHKKSP